VSELGQPPSLPVVVARLVGLCSQDSYAVGELVQLLETDPPLASRLLRLSNSAYYGFRREVDSISRAVLVLGRVTVQAVALASAVLEPWRGKAVPAVVGELWTHAYLCGLGCRHLGRRLAASPWRSSPDVLFLTGLLHDLGKLLFLVREPEAYAEALERGGSRAEMLEWERERFGVDHAEAGGDALDRWALPERMAAVVRHHHSGGLRVELRPDWEVLRATDDLLGGLSQEPDGGEVPQELRADLGAYLAGARAEAKAFYEAIA
jgi:HD-like signal output (HDOD) protein